MKTYPHGFRRMDRFLGSAPRVRLTRIRPTSVWVVLGAMAVLGSITPPESSLAADFVWEAVPASGNWENPNNWSGPNLEIPDDNTDRATIGGGVPSPVLSANRTIGELIVQNEGKWSNGDGTTNFSLIVQNNGGRNGTTTASGEFSYLFIHQSPSAIDLDTDNLRTENEGAVFIYNGARVQVDNLLSIGSTSVFGGNGILEFGSSASTNDGHVSAGGQGSLVVRAIASGELDPDGIEGNGSLFAFFDSFLHIQAPLSDSVFNGTLQIDSNGEIRIDQAWTLGATGGAVINFQGNCCAGASDFATLSGGDVTLSGAVNILNGTAVLGSAQTTIANTAVVTVADDASLQFDSPTMIEDPESIQNGFNTTFIVNEHVRVGMGAGNFDWDGTGQNGFVSGRTIVNEEGLLDIAVMHLDSANDVARVSSELTLIGGDILIQSLDGEVEFDGLLRFRNPDGLTVPYLDSPDNAFETSARISGAVIVDGQGTSSIGMDTVFTNSSSVSVAAGSNLNLGGLHGESTLILGGTWTGSGAVDLDADVTTIGGATQVFMPNGTFDMDGDFGPSQVIVNQPLTLNVASVESSADTNRIDAAVRINNNGRLDVRFTNPSHTYTLNNDLELNGLGGGFASLHLAGSDVLLAGTTLVTGNSQATSRVEVSGTLNLSPGSSFVLRGGSEASPSVIRAEASVFGLGNLVVSASGPGYLRLNDNSIAGVAVTNNGHFEVGSSPGQATVASFTQTSSGVYEVEIDGLAPTTGHDQLLVAGTANLDGTLEVNVNDHGGTYSDPIFRGLFDQFRLIVAADLNGSFDAFLYDSANMGLAFSANGQDRYHAGAGLFRILDYDAVQLDLLNYLALPGDANGDGFVDGSDFGIWNANKFTAGTDWTTGDFNGDGVTDGSDFGIWNANKFSGVDLGRDGGGNGLGFGTRLATVPEPTVFLLLGSLLVGYGTVRRYGGR